MAAKSIQCSNATSSKAFIVWSFGLKLGSVNTQYTSEIYRLHEAGFFRYIELFVPPGTYTSTVGYWKELPFSFVIHAPHSAAGMNLSDSGKRKANAEILTETFCFADTLAASHIIIHSGVDGPVDECVTQLRPFKDGRILIENKPSRGVNGEKCVGCTVDELMAIIGELNAGFCLDFGHAICAANTFGINPLTFIDSLMRLAPTMFHLTDGDFSSEIDSHEHYGKGTFPLRTLLNFVPVGACITNEAKKSSSVDLLDYDADINFIRSL